MSDLDLDLVDEAGVTGRQRLGYLQNAREHFRALELEDSVDARILRAAQQNLASRCVVSILHANGRAQFQFDPEESARGGFRLNGDTPDELVIAADLAKYTFWKGEFPAYDQARALASGRENIVPSDHRESLEGLYLEALRSFGMDSESTVTLKR